MQETTPRFEFRIFGDGLQFIEQRMRRLAPCDAIDESREIYILGATGTDHNLKIRHGHLESKTLVERDGDLERWRPTGRWAFPVPWEVLQSLSLEPSDMEVRGESQAIDVAGLLARVRPRHGLFRANVHKRRFRFSIAGCAAERDELWVNGAAIQSLALEASEAGAVTALRARLGLADAENVAYPLALSRILGLCPLPRENTYEQRD